MIKYVLRGDTMKTLLLEEKNIDKITEILNHGGVVALPTETVFGLAVKYDCVSGLQQLYKIKQRASNKAITLMVPTIEDIQKFAYVDTFSIAYIEKFMPGKITIILNKREFIDDQLTAKLPTIGIRIPDQPILLEILKKVGPMWVTSANLSNQKDLVYVDDVYNQFDGQIDGVVNVDAGNDLPSTVVQLINQEIKILRIGSISEKEIMEEIK